MPKKPTSNAKAKAPPEGKYDDSFRRGFIKACETLAQDGFLYAPLQRILSRMPEDLARLCKGNLSKVMYYLDAEAKGTQTPAKLLRRLRPLNLAYETWIVFVTNASNLMAPCKEIANIVTSRGTTHNQYRNAPFFELYLLALLCKKGLAAGLGPDARKRMQAVRAKCHSLNKEADALHHLQEEGMFSRLPEDIRGCTPHGAGDIVGQFLAATSSQEPPLNKRQCPYVFKAFHEEFDAEISNFSREGKTCYRKDVIKRIRAFLRNPAGRQTLTIVGGPGTGKTILALTLLDQLSKEGIRLPYFLVALGRGDRDIPRLILTDIAIQLSPTILDEGTLGPPAYDSEAIGILKKAFECVAPSEQVFILLDGVDETDPQWHDRSSLSTLLKQIALPANVHLILFSRPSVALFDLVREYDIALEAKDLQDAALARFYRKKLRGVASARINIPRLIEYTEGSFLYAELVTVSEIIESFAEGVPDDKVTAPRGLAAKLKKERDRLCKGPVGPEETSKILSTLVAHRGSPTLAEWARFSEVQWLTLDIFLQAHEGLFKLEDRRTCALEPSLRTHGFKHTEIRRYMAENLIGEQDVCRAHERIVDTYRRECPNNRWHKHPRDPYFFTNIVRHMLACSRYIECVDLLTTSVDWMEAQRHACESDAPFREDVTNVMAAIPAEDSPENLVAWTKLWAARLVSDYSQNVPDDVLILLARLGRVLEAVIIADSREDPTKRLRSLVSLYSILYDDSSTTLLHKVADLVAQFDSADNLSLSLDELISVQEISARMDVTKTPEYLSSKREEAIGSLFNPADNIHVLTRFATASYRLNDVEGGRTILTLAEAQWEHAYLKSRAKTRLLSDLLEVVIRYDTAKRDFFIVKARELVDDSLRSGRFFVEHIPLVQVVLAYQPKADASQLLDKILETALQRKWTSPDFWVTFLKWCLLSPTPRTSVIEVGLTKVRFSTGRSSIHFFARLSLALSRSSLVAVAQEFADKAAANYEILVGKNESADNNASERAHCLIALAAAYEQLGNSARCEQYLAAGYNEISRTQDAASRITTICMCIGSLIDAGMVDLANRALNIFLPLVHDTSIYSENNDYRAAVVDLLTLTGHPGEAFKLRDWSKATSHRRTASLIYLSAALSASGAQDEADVVCKDYLHSVEDKRKVVNFDKAVVVGVHIKGNSPSFYRRRKLDRLNCWTFYDIADPCHVYAPVLRRLVNAGLEQEAFDACSKMSDSKLLCQYINLWIGQRAVRHGDHRRALQYSIAALQSVEEILSPGTAGSHPNHLAESEALDQTHAKEESPDFSGVPEILRSITVLLRQVAEIPANAELLARIRTCLRLAAEGSRVPSLVPRLIWTTREKTAELEIEDLQRVTALVDDCKSPEERIGALRYLATRTAREKRLAEAEQLWDTALCAIRENDGLDKIEEMLMLTRSMREFLPSSKIAPLLHEIQQALDALCSGSQLGSDYKMDLVTQYVQLGLNEEAKQILLGVDTSLATVSVEAMVGVLAKHGLYRLALSTLIHTDLDRALDISVFAVLPAMESCRPGLSVEVLSEIAVIFSWIRPEWSPVAALLRPVVCTS